MSKKNIGATLALYPCPVIVVGAMVNDKPTWTLVAHAGTVAQSHLMVSLVQVHYINQGIRESELPTAYAYAKRRGLRAAYADTGQTLARCPVSPGLLL